MQVQNLSRGITTLLRTPHYKADLWWKATGSKLS